MYVDVQFKELFQKKLFWQVHALPGLARLAKVCFLV